jgi:arsenate reductase
MKTLEKLLSYLSTMDGTPFILILGNGNSCRSQLAEGILRKALGERYEVASAGLQPAETVHPLALRVMEEIGIDISIHRPMDVQQFLSRPIDTVITVYVTGELSDPSFQGHPNHHRFSFANPADCVGTDEEQLTAFRNVRDEIRLAFSSYAAGRLDEERRNPPVIIATP